jgi:hypothetical protein
MPPDPPEGRRPHLEALRGGLDLRNEEISRASEHALAAGQRFLDAGNLLAAGAVYFAAMRVIGTHPGFLQEKTALSRLLGDTLETLGVGRVEPDPDRARHAFEHAARFWTERPAPFSGHRGMCSRCSGIKDLCWIRCAHCPNAGEFADHAALSLLMSERAAPLDVLMAGDERTRALRDLAPDAARVLSKILPVKFPSGTPAGAVFVPSVVVALRDPTRRVAVLVEVLAGNESVESGPAFHRFVARACEAALEGGDWRASLEPARRAAEHDLGGWIEIGRVERVDVRHGAVMTSQLAEAKEGQAARAWIHSVASAAAIEATDDVDHPAIADLAEAAADALLAIEGESTGAGDGGSSGLRDALLQSRLQLDPSLSFQETTEVLGRVLSTTLTLGGVARLARRRRPDAGPGDVPRSQALRG